MIKNLFLIAKEKKELVVTTALWLMIWAGYNTSIVRFFNPDFPTSIFDAVHAFRALFPIVAGMVAVVLLLKSRQKLQKGFFVTPVGLLTIFTVIGLISSLVFSNNPVEAVYWGLMYGAVILVLLHSLQNKNHLRTILRINIVIAGTIAAALFIFFLVREGSLKTLVDGSLLCSERPYETIGQLKAGGLTFDMPGTRPTGLGRYAGIAALALFASLFFKQQKRIRAVASFFLFCFIVFFAKGRAVIGAFTLSLALLVLMIKPKMRWLLVLAAIILFSAFLIFFTDNCRLDLDYGRNTTSLHLASTKDISPLLTLSGRSTGVWAKSWNLFLGSPVIGYGFQADRFFLNGEHAHNTLLHALVQAGLLGAIPFMIACLYCIFMVFRLYNSQFISKEDKVILIQVIGILAFILLRGVTESFAYYSADWLFLAPMIAYIQYLYFSKSHG